jgi:hypothetical protein
MVADGNGYQIDAHAVEEVARQLADHAREYDALIKAFNDIPLAAGIPPVGSSVAAAALHVQGLLGQAQTALLSFLNQTNHPVTRAAAGYLATDEAGGQTVGATVADVGGGVGMHAGSPRGLPEATPPATDDPVERDG